MKNYLYEFIKKFFALVISLSLLSLIVFSLFHFQLLLPDQVEPNLTEEEIPNIVNLSSEESEEGEENEKLLEEEVIESNDGFDYQEKERQAFKSDVLSVSGIVSLTNLERTKNNLSSLKNNQNLNLIAKKKARDIIENNYFAHISPTGEAIGDLAEKNSYDYILIGENLARGNFESDEEIVQGWMNSPPHRKNILKDSFTEIGVAAEKGIYKGQSVWVGVQVFATPASTCPKVNNNLLIEIEKNKETMDNLIAEIEELEVEISETNNRSEYNQKVDRYNRLVNEYNNLREELDSSINIYNNQVEERNICINNYK